MQAVREGDTTGITRLPAAGGRGLDATHSYTWLVLMARRANREILELLLEKGTSGHAEGREGRMALEHATRKSQEAEWERLRWERQG